MKQEREREREITLQWPIVDQRRRLQSVGLAGCKLLPRYVPYTIILCRCFRITDTVAKNSKYRASGSYRSLAIVILPAGLKRNDCHTTTGTRTRRGRGEGKK